MTPSASRNGRQRKKSADSAASPRSAISSTSPLAGQTLELLRQEAPDLVVHRFVAAADRAAHHSLAPEAQEGDDVLRRLVGGRDLGVDAVGVVFLESPHAGLPLGLAGDAAPPGLRVADEDRQLRAKLPIEAEQRHESDRLLPTIQHDRPLAVAARVHGPLHPAARVVLGEGVAVADQVGCDARVVEPAVGRRGVVGSEVAQGDVGRHRPQAIYP